MGRAGGAAHGKPNMAGTRDCFGGVQVLVSGHGRSDLMVFQVGDGPWLGVWRRVRACGVWVAAALV